MDFSKKKRKMMINVLIIENLALYLGKVLRTFPVIERTKIL